MHTHKHARACQKWAARGKHRTCEMTRHMLYMYICYLLETSQRHRRVRQTSETQIIATDSSHVCALFVHIHKRVIPWSVQSRLWGCILAQNSFQTCWDPTGVWIMLKNWVLRVYRRKGVSMYVPMLDWPIIFWGHAGALMHDSVYCHVCVCVCVCVCVGMCFLGPLRTARCAEVHNVCSKTAIQYVHFARSYARICVHTNTHISKVVYFV